jgi:hypothetical protein
MRHTIRMGKPIANACLAARRNVPRKLVSAFPGCLKNSSKAAVGHYMSNLLDKASVGSAWTVAVLRGVCTSLETQAQVDRMGTAKGRHPRRLPLLSRPSIAAFLQSRYDLTNE